MGIDNDKGVPVLRKLVFSFIWFLVIFVGLCLLVGLKELVVDSANAKEIGRSIGDSYGKWLLILSIVAAPILSFKGLLPGTKKIE